MILTIFRKSTGQPPLEINLQHVELDDSGAVDGCRALMSMFVVVYKSSIVIFFRFLRLAAFFHPRSALWLPAVLHARCPRRYGKIALLGECSALTDQEERSVEMANAMCNFWSDRLLH